MKDDKVYLQHIIESCEFIVRHTKKDPKAFSNNPLVRDATLRNLQTLAESASRVSLALKHLHPDVDWKGIAGFRNVLVHDYLGLDLKIVWDVIERDLPVLHKKIKAILSKLKENS